MPSFHANWALVLACRLDLHDMLPFNLWAGIFKVFFILNLCFNLVLRVDRIKDKSERGLGSLLQEDFWSSSSLVPILTHSASMAGYRTLPLEWLRLLRLKAKPRIRIIGYGRPSATLLMLLFLCMQGTLLKVLRFLLWRFWPRFMRGCYLLLLPLLASFVIFVCILSRAGRLKFLSDCMVGRLWLQCLWICCSRWVGIAT